MRPRTTALTLTSSHTSLRRVTAIVLAGGASQRFPPDKLAQLVGDEPLLDRSLASLPQDFVVVVVGSVREVARPAIFTSEDPPGGGPAAALVAGVRRALAESTDAIVTLPADAPLGGEAAMTLLSRLEDDPSLEAVVGIDSSGREQPLQLALRPAAAGALVSSRRAWRRSRSIGPSTARCAAAWIGRRTSWRRLQLWDIDTPDQLARLADAILSSGVSDLGAWRPSVRLGLITPLSSPSMARAARASRSWRPQSHYGPRLRCSKGMTSIGIRCPG